MRHVDIEIAGLARRQHGVVAGWQLRLMGIDPGVARRRVAAGRWERRAPGVFALLSHPKGWRQAVMVAVLSSGPGAAASHATAAHLWGWWQRPKQIEVTVKRSRWKPTDFMLHRTTDLEPGHVAHLEGIPLTVPARTLIDLGASIEPLDHAQVFDEALRSRRVSLERVAQMLSDVARQGRTGVGTARRILEARMEFVGIPESVLEDEFVRIVDDARIPRPRRQVEVAGIDGAFLARVDFLFDAGRLVVEIDGLRFHDDPVTFQADRERQNLLTLAGFRILRFTAVDLFQRRGAVVDAVVAALDAAA